MSELNRIIRVIRDYNTTLDNDMRDDMAVYLESLPITCAKQDHDELIKEAREFTRDARHSHNGTANAFISRLITALEGK